MSAAFTVAASPGVRTPRFDLGARPYLVLIELTRACDLACRHCRAEASPDRDPCELSTAEVCEIFSDLAALGPPRPIVVLTGGDPFKRDDLSRLVAQAARLKLPVALSPSATPLASRERLASVAAAGARTVSFSIDGASASSHDAFRGVEGSFEWTLRAAKDARQAGLRLQLNTTVTAATVGELPALARLALALQASLWSVFFLVEVGRGTALGTLGSAETEDVLHFLYDLSASVPLKTTEAPQFRRIVAQRAAGEGPGNRGPRYFSLAEQWEAGGPAGAPPPKRKTPLRSPLAVGDGRGVVFVSHVGEIMPSGFLPLVVGNVRTQSLTTHYRHDPLLAALRDPERLSGRCGRCEYRTLCGGSRARAYASCRDPLGQDPACPYVPQSPRQQPGGRHASTPE